MLKLLHEPVVLFCSQAVRFLHAAEEGGNEEEENGAEAPNNDDLGQDGKQKHAPNEELAYADVRVSKESKKQVRGRFHFIRIAYHIP